MNEKKTTKDMDTFILMLDCKGFRLYSEYLRMNKVDLSIKSCPVYGSCSESITNTFSFRYLLHFPSSQ